MQHLPGLILALAFAAAPARADLLAFESGRGNHNSRGSDAWFLRYQHDMAPLWNSTGFIEFAGGAWDGSIKNRAFGAGGGLRYALTKRSYASLAAGLAWVTDRTENLGTHPQFQWRFALGWRVGRVDLALAQIHYSNGKSIFGWDGTNVGDNFLTLQIGYLP
jgi:Lipid A 3-O-deacylase (PagL)